jgi:ribonuclease HI
MFPWLTRLQLAHVYTDGAIRSKTGASGLAAIVRDERGQIQHWWSRRNGRMTCNEAEYAAVILALECLHSIRPKEIHIYSDSQVVVHQMQGIASAHAPALRRAQIRARELVAQYERVIFHHIPREHNRLADALANDAVDGRWG